MEADRVAKLDAELLAFLQEELEAQGSGPDGLYQWYRNRFVPTQIGLSPYDRGIAGFVLEHCAAYERFVEIGAGIGQCCMLLALSRRHSYPVESNHVNFAMMNRAMLRIADRVDTELPNYMTPINVWYPDNAAQYVTTNSLLCFPTLSWGLTPEDEQRILDTMRLAGGVIVGLRTFFLLRESKEEQQTLIDQIRERGFGAPVEVVSWQQPLLGFQPDRVVFMKNEAL